MRRYVLTEEPWERLAPWLPPPKETTDDQQIIDGTLWLLRTGAPLRDLPDVYGP